MDTNPQMENQNPSMEERKNQTEILLSRDFSNMNLEELERVQKQFSDIAGYVKDVQEHVKLTEEQRKARDFLWYRIKEEENKNDLVKVGDIFHTSWGYEQTNSEIFKVVKISKTGKTCDVVQIGTKTIEGSEGFMSDTVTADPSIILNEGQTCKVKIERSTTPHPYKTEIYKGRTIQKRMPIGEINLRGSVFYGDGIGKHLTNLYRLDEVKGAYRSWYY
tara:strand:+ start:224 stop:880 length:657 start_codon:yes stop_codon:yes gene_type:complete